MDFGGVDSAFAFLLYLWTMILHIPGMSYVVGYIKNSYQNDPIRIVLEGFLVLYTIKYLQTKKRSNSDEELLEHEIDELIEEWMPAPLVPAELPPLARFNLDTINPITSKVGIFVATEQSKEKLLNLVSFNPLGILNLPALKDVAAKAIKKYGVGTCGPPGFYGTLDIHLELERAITEFLGTTSAILYSQNFSAASSVIPAFSKRGDIVVCDDGINFALQKGVQISRSDIFYFIHNDLADLERVLVDVEQMYKNKPLTRRFIVTEGLFAKYGDICPLPQLVLLKKKYKYRLILDESLSIGSIGARGAGLTDFYAEQVSVSDIDMIIGSLGHAFGATGGFCAGSTMITDHQRLGGQAYCFSASLPALLTAFALAAIKSMPGMEEAERASCPEAHETIEKSLARLPTNISLFQRLLVSRLPPSFELRSNDPMGRSCLFYIQMVATESKNDPKLGMEDVCEEEKILQRVVDLAAMPEKNLYITRSKSVYTEDIKNLPPSIKICISGAWSERQLKEDVVDKLVEAFTKVSDEKLR